MYQQYNTWF